VAGGEVGVPDAGAEQVRELPQEPVAGLVAEVLVHLTEVVEVDVDDGVAGGEALDEGLGMTAVADADLVVAAQVLGELADDPDLFEGRAGLGGEQQGELLGERVVAGLRLADDDGPADLGLPDEGDDQQGGAVLGDEADLTGLHGVGDQLGHLG
jgi:hypothetical protein